MPDDMSTNPHPVTYFVMPQMTSRNRLTCFFRAILALPHMLIAGGPGATASLYGYGPTGALGMAAAACAFVSWFAIVFMGRMPRGLWDLMSYYLRWRSRAVAYAALLTDDYPPFGDGDYPAAFGLGEFPEVRRRWSVGLRLFALIPHAIVLAFLGLAWLVTAFIGWLAILVTGSYPEGLYRFGTGYLRWSLRVEAYGLLMHDEYPPFSLD